MSGWGMAFERIEDLLDETGYPQQQPGVSPGFVDTSPGGL